MSRATASSPERHRARRLAPAIVLSALSWSLVVAAPAVRADPCSLLDPACILDSAEQTVGQAVPAVEQTTDAIIDTVDDTVQTVEDTADDAVETVESTVGTVVDTIEDAIDPVEDVVDPILDDPLGAEPRVVADPATRPGGGNGGGGQDPAGHGSTGAPTDRPHAVSPVAGSIGSVPAGSPLGGPLGGSLGGPAEIGRLAVQEGPAAFGFRAPIEPLAFPLVLALLVIGFAGLQNRLDRRDPKLSVAPVGPDVLGFA